MKQYLARTPVTYMLRRTLCPWDIERVVDEKVDQDGVKRTRTTEREITTTHAEILSTKFTRRIENVVTNIVSKPVSEVKQSRMEWSGGAYRRKNNDRLKRLREEHSNVFADRLDQPVASLVAEELQEGFRCLERARAGPSSRARRPTSKRRRQKRSLRKTVKGSATATATATARPKPTPCRALRASACTQSSWARPV